MDPLRRSSRWSTTNNSSCPGSNAFYSSWSSDPTGPGEILNLLAEKTGEKRKKDQPGSTAESA